MANVTEMQIRAAEGTRRRAIYVCFEEPTEPENIAVTDHPDDIYRDEKFYPKVLCKDHVALGCGWYNLTKVVSNEHT